VDSKAEEARGEVSTRLCCAASPRRRLGYQRYRAANAAASYSLECKPPVYPRQKTRCFPSFFRARRGATSRRTAASLRGGIFILGLTPPGYTMSPPFGGYANTVPAPDPGASATRPYDVAPIGAQKATPPPATQSEGTRHFVRPKFLTAQPHPVPHQGEGDDISLSRFSEEKRHALSPLPGGERGESSQCARPS
jgi:hypothetical protein